MLLALALLALNTGWVSARLGFLHKPHQVAEHDHLRYLAMARGEQGDAELARQSPYCWRVAVPAAAALLARTGMKLNLAFWPSCWRSMPGSSCWASLCGSAWRGWPSRAWCRAACAGSRCSTG